MSDIIKSVSFAELYDAWPALSIEERVEGFEILPRGDAEEFFLKLTPRDQAEMILVLSPADAGRRIFKCNYHRAPHAQFNPLQYSVSRGCCLSRTKGCFSQ